MCGRRLGKNFLTLLQHWSGAVMCPACLCGGEAAGHNALRGSGPNRKHAFKDALTHAGSPDPRIDLVCITSSCPRQFLQNFKRRHRCLASPPLSSSFDTTSLYHFDAAERAPSTASKADMTPSNCDVRFTPESGHSPTRSGCLLWAKSGHQLELFDHLVGASEQRRGYGEGERFCRLYIDQELELGRLINRDVARFGSFEDLVHVIGHAPE